MDSLVQTLWHHRGLRRLFWLGVTVAVVLAGWLGVLTVRNSLFLARTGLDAGGSSPTRMAAKEILTELIKPYYDTRLVATTSLPIYDVELSERRLAEWHGILQRVTERGKSVPEDQVWIPATFHRGDEEWQVDIRGRGTLAGHYRLEKPSFRVRFPRDRYFDGRRVVNFIIPYEQARVLVDTTLNEVARQYGMLAYPRGFAVVRMNGEVLGVYHQMEHFRKEMAVLQGRSEGYFASALGEGKGGADPADHPGFGEAVAALKACTDHVLAQRARNNATPGVTVLERRATEVCPEAMARHLLDTYFDFERTALYAALTTWFESDHAWGPDNLILFFDPGRGRFEPIPWDVGQHPIYRREGAEEHPEAVFESVVDVGAAFLDLEDFRQRRNDYLWDLVHRKEAFALAEATRQYDAIRPDLDFDTEYSRARTERFYIGFQRIVRGNSELLREVLAQTRLEIEMGPEGVLLRNPGATEVEVESLALIGPEGQRFDLVTGTPGTAVTVPGRWRQTLGQLELGEVEALAASGLEPRTLRAEGRAWNRLSGEALDFDTVEVVAGPGRSPMPSPPSPLSRSSERGDTSLPSPSGTHALSPEPRPGSEPDPRAVEEIATPPAGVRAEIDETGERWSFSGTITLDASIALPAGVDVVFEPGLDLRLGEEVDLVIRGDLTSLGTAGAPIRIAAADPSRPFATLAVLGRSHDPAEVRVEHTTVDGGREGDFRGVHFLGSFSIYDGHLTMRHSQILNSAGEDGLNVKFGSVILEDSLFQNTAGDALDLDFCHGTLVRNTVRQSAADGFDFSGAVVEVRDNLFTDLADKGVSIGEDTTVVAIDNRIERATTGFAVKDLSLAHLEDNVFVDLEVGVAIYQKKQVFGSGLALHDPASLDRVASGLLEDPGAQVYRPRGGRP